MLRTALLCLILVVSLSSSTSIIKKSLKRRQADSQHCEAITGFDCKCNFYRVTCTIDHELPSPIHIVDHEKQKYQSVELVIQAPRDIHVNDQTFEPVKELYKPDGDNLEFRIKFEKFTALHLSSPSIFNRVFPDSLPAHARKHLALEIYNPEVAQQDNPNLFQNLNAESLELYALYPFHGTFQELFKDANIKFLRLSGGDIRSDVSQPFSGNVARLELAKQASALSVQNFPVYPAHELTINAFYITDFNNEHPPNYGNLGELRVHSPSRIPANAFRQFPNIHTLSVQSDQGIDPHAFDGLTHLEKLTIKDGEPNLDLFNNLPNLKEFEASIEKLDANTQCKLIEKLANGQVAIQAVPNGRECTCVSAYLDTAAGRLPCSPQGCENSPCAAIKNNYNAETSTFNPPPQIRRSDGSDALRQREPRVYSVPFQVAQQDQQKLQNAVPPPQPEQPDEDQRRPDGDNQGPDAPYDPQDPDYYSSNVEITQTEKPYPDPSSIYENPWENDPNYYNSNIDNSQTEKPDAVPSPKYENPWEDDPNYYNSNVDNSQTEKPDAVSSPKYENPWEDDPNYYNSNDQAQETTTELIPQDSWNQYPVDIDTTVPPFDPDNNDVQGGQGHAGHPDGDHHGGHGSEQGQEGGVSHPQDGETGNQPDGGNTQPGGSDAEGVTDPNAEEGTAPPKKGMSWLPIIIIAASIIGLLLIGFIILLLRKRRAAASGGNTKAGYNTAPTTEQRA
ncbi:unnamed protein product [Adineta steineri]|uniref:Uncharacterized protein n=1 Tax=Adineta steineri TaxID=433720 RepID=A0A814RKT8_9BILA|nr:unnamed protein product [Adineta steineri]CAF3765664.1 unnamed protein product [Adineta steineri]